MTVDNVSLSGFADMVAEAADDHEVRPGPPCRTKAVEVPSSAPASLNVRSIYSTGGGSFSRQLRRVPRLNTKFTLCIVSLVFVASQGPDAEKRPLDAESGLCT